MIGSDFMDFGQRSWLSWPTEMCCKFCTVWQLGSTSHNAHPAIPTDGFCVIRQSTGHQFQINPAVEEGKRFPLKPSWPCPRSRDCDILAALDFVRRNAHATMDGRNQYVGGISQPGGIRSGLSILPLNTATYFPFRWSMCMLHKVATCDDWNIWVALCTVPHAIRHRHRVLVLALIPSSSVIILMGRSWSKAFILWHPLLNYFVAWWTYGEQFPWLIYSLIWCMPILYVF